MKPYYEAGGITLYHGNCLDVLPTLERVDHVITDPPYEAEAHTKGRRTKRGNVTQADRDDRWQIIDERGTPRYESLDFEPLTECIRREAATHMARLARRWCAVFSQAEGAHLWEAALQVAGHSRRRWCIWVKPDAQPQFSGDRPGVGYETIVTTHAQGRSQWNGGGRVGVFTYVKSRGENGHMTEKPLPLMRELVTLFTDPGDLILDPFAGSGTTLLAAQIEGRRAIGIELEEKWCEVAANRLRYGTKGAAMVATGQSPLWAPGGTA